VNVFGGLLHRECKRKYIGTSASFVVTKLISVLCQYKVAVFDHGYLHHYEYWLIKYVCCVWRLTVATSGTCTEVTARRPRLVLGWLTIREDRALWTRVRSSVWTYYYYYQMFLLTLHMQTFDGLIVGADLHLWPTVYRSPIAVIVLTRDVTWIEPNNNLGCTDCGDLQLELTACHVPAVISSDVRVTCITGYRSWILLTSLDYSK